MGFTEPKVMVVFSACSDIVVLMCNVSHRLEGLNVWSSVLQIFQEVLEPLVCGCN